MIPLSGFSYRLQFGADRREQHSVRNSQLSLFWKSIRWLVQRRYRVTVSGSESLRDLNGPTLVLPNHPAYIDPAIVLSHLRFGKDLRPLVFAGTFRRWFLGPLMRMTRAVEVPDMQRGKGESIRKTVHMINSVVDGVKSGDSYLIYPSGRLQRGNEEFVGGARIVSEVITRCPDVNVVLVRTTGIWGSMFSCARTGNLPNLGWAFLKSIGWLLAGGLLFVPKRNIALHVEILDPRELPGVDRKTLNGFLEDWYNIPGQQDPVFVRYNKVLGPRRGKFASVVAHTSAEVAGTALDNHP